MAAWIVAALLGPMGAPASPRADQAMVTVDFRDAEVTDVVRLMSATLAAEHAERRRLADERRSARPMATATLRLSYARAAELAPLLERYLSPQGRVSYDARTNTLFISDVN
jgi:type II secretory pathway component GspD/PulD (secretin)